VIADRLVSLSDPDARPIRKGKPGRPTEFGSTLLVAEDERGVIADTSSSRATQRRPAADPIGAAGGGGHRPAARDGGW
jgi:hypothetical protein